MSIQLKDLKAKFDSLDDELVSVLKNRQRALHYRIENGRAIFAHEIKETQRALKKSAAKSFSEAWMRNLISAPFIYSIAAPVVLLDLFASLYQNISFRLWRIPLVRRRDHVILDRYRLAYLNWVQKINCFYCEYTNGVLSYVSEIASRTEQYWCPIKHATPIVNPHKRYLSFLDYGDTSEFEEKFYGCRNQFLQDGKTAKAKKP